MKIYSGLLCASLLGLAACGSNNTREDDFETIYKNDIQQILSKNQHFFDSLKNPTKKAFLLKGGEYFPDYEHPRTLNEKVIYVLYNYFMKSPITSVIGNKYYAKKFVVDLVGEQHVVKLLGVWDNPQDIEWDKLPNKFVLKSVRGHFGRQVILVNDKSKLNIPETIKKLEEFCELPFMQKYKNKRIIAEEYIDAENGLSVDYKFFCSYGKPLFAYCLATKQSEERDVDTKTFSFYSVPEWKRIPAIAGRHAQNSIPKPKHFKKMLEVASKLSKDFPLIRVDLFEVGNRVLLGELTEDASGGKNIISPVTWDFILGEKISVPSKDELNELITRDKIKSEKWLD